MCVREDVFCVLRGWRERFAYEGSVYGAVEESFFFENVSKAKPNHVQTSLLLKHSTKYMPLNLGD